jgi:hypothetical protein
MPLTMPSQKSLLKKRVSLHPEREDRILFDIVVDAYNDSERAMGWYYYLENEISFPFKARCISKRATSPLIVDQPVEVVGLADEDECMEEVMVTITLADDELAVPLAQLDCVKGKKGTRQAVEDWHYWVGRGYHY